MNAPVQAGPTPASMEHLRLLAIGHYVFAALGLLGLVFVAGHYAFMLSVVDMGWDQGGPSTQFQWMLTLGYATIALFVAGWAALNLVAARSLQHRRRWMLCVVVAGIDCLNVPLGTLLGVCTLVVLNQPGVKQVFD